MLTNIQSLFEVNFDCQDHRSNFETLPKSVVEDGMTVGME